MNELDKYIDNLFEQKLSGASMPGASSGVEWTKIGKALQKKSFLKFSLAKFNIYYLSSLIIATAITGFVLFPSLSKSDKNEQIPVEPQPVLVDSTEMINCIPLDQDTLIIDQDSIKEAIGKEKNKETVLKNEIESCNSKPEKTVNKKEPVIQEKTEPDIELKSLVKDVNDSASCNPLHPKIQSITTSDTIFIADTIRIQKKRKIIRREK